MPYRWAAVLLFDRGPEHARFLAVHGEGGPDEGVDIPLGELPPADVLRAKGVRYLEDLAGRDECFPIFPRLVAGGTRSLISAPLVAGGEPIGLLCVGQPEARGFDGSHTEIVGEVAMQLAVAIHQARLREALDRQQQRLQAVVEHLPEGVALLERDGQVALANPLARRHLETVATRSAAGDVTGARRPAARARAPARPKMEPREVTGEDGGAVFQVAAQRLADGQGAVVVIREITREREAQKIAQQQARLASVGQLAAGIAHDFNNILMTIMTSRRARPCAARPTRRSCASGSRWWWRRASGRRCSCARSSTSAGSRRPRWRRSTSPCCWSRRWACSQRTLPETIAIVVEAGEGPFSVSADPNQLTQVLTNLAVNARDVMPLGGELRFRLAQERRAAAADGSGPGPGQWIVLSVTDTGSGMPREVRERVFDPFFTTKAPGRGTGLGLSQAYGIVTEHQGHITVESRPDQGTTFTIYLPSLAERQPAVAAADDSDLALGHGETVLVVEDEAPVRLTLAHLLAELNYQVLTASSAENALEIHAAHAGEVALVLTDLVMPGMGGLGLVRELRQRNGALPVVMMSGYVGDSSHASVEGVLAWVEKPVTARRLGVVLQEAMLARA